MCCMCAVCVGAQRHTCAGAGVPGSWYWVMGWGLGARGGQAGAGGSSPWVLCSDGVYAPPLSAFPLGCSARAQHEVT